MLYVPKATDGLEGGGGATGGLEGGGGATGGLERGRGPTGGLEGGRGATSGCTVAKVGTEICEYGGGLYGGRGSVVDWIPWATSLGGLESAAESDMPDFSPPEDTFSCCDLAEKRKWRPSMTDT